MQRLDLLLLTPFLLVGALPGNPELVAQIKAQLASTTGANFPCLAKECKKPMKKYELMLNAQPGIQWMDHGGYCGAWSVQRAAMTKGVWISQQQVRNHTVPGGGHDQEILETNIALALKNLKLKFEGFDYKNLPTPQADAYRKWIKAKLAAGHPVVWMVMLQGDHYPVYPSLAPYGQYGHVEPVVGILSDRPLNDTNWYDDDVLVHYTDADEHTYYRAMNTLADDESMQGACAHGDYIGYPCLYEKYGFGWSIEGLEDPTGAVALPLSLTVQPSRSEPDTRLGDSPVPLSGTVTVMGLTLGEQYGIYRWDSVQSAFDYQHPVSIHKFVAAATTEIYKDPVSFRSDGTTYYKCIGIAPQDATAVLV